MLVDPSVGQQEIKQPGTLGELESVLALVGEEGANVHGEVLLVGQR